MVYSLSVSGSVLTINISGSLDYNTQYSVTVGAGISGLFAAGVSNVLDDDYTFWFTSTYCPLFSTVGRVKLQTGPTVDSIPDDTVYRLIHKNSKDVIDIYNTYHNKSYSYTKWGCDPETGIPYTFRRYVECKTAYDLLAIMELIYTSGGLGTGGQLKTLGDLTIRYDGSNTGGNCCDPTRKKQLYDCWMDAMHALTVTGDAGLQSAVKGWYDVTKQYPHPTFDQDHNRVIRTVETIRARPCGPFRTSTYWRPRV